MTSAPSSMHSKLLLKEAHHAPLQRTPPQVRGIGRWTADMFAMFHLGRPDVLPVGDLGVRKGFQILYGLKVSPSSCCNPGSGNAPCCSSASTTDLWLLDCNRPQNHAKQHCGC